MNTILQKRIIDKANAIINFNLVDLNDLVNQHDLFKMLIEIATFALQNQWIPVDEALPEIDGHGYSKPVLVMDDTNELLVSTYSKIYDKWNAVGHVSYHRLVVTHWMEIPKLKGGEK